MKTKLSVWRDGDSVVVSQDTDDHSTTLMTFAGDQMAAAKEYAADQSATLGIPAVIESPSGSGQWRSL